MLQQLELLTTNQQSVVLSYQTFGKALGTAPVVLVNHALTGNSTVVGENGWWNDLIGDAKTIDTQKFTVLAFDVPGNGYTDFFIENYTDFTTKAIAKLYWDALALLKVTQLFAIIGGSLGGSIAWEMAFLQPNAVLKIIPIACNYKASDWLIGNVHVQTAILNNSKNALEDARMHAMLLYRTPESFDTKFQLKKNAETEIYKVEEWLNYHGKSLNDRFQLQSYRLMNHLLKTIGAEITEDEFEQFLKNASIHIHIIAINSDYMFTEKEQYATYQRMKGCYKNVSFQVIDSIHGHDAFLIESKQLHQLTQHYF